MKEKFNYDLFDKNFTHFDHVFVLHYFNWVDECDDIMIFADEDDVFKFIKLFKIKQFNLERYGVYFYEKGD